MDFFQAIQSMADGRDYYPRKLRVPGGYVCTVQIVPARTTTTQADIIGVLRERGPLTQRAIMAALDGLLDAVHAPGDVRSTLADLVRSKLVRRTRRGFMLASNHRGQQ